MLQSMGSQRVRHNGATELKYLFNSYIIKNKRFNTTAIFQNFTISSSVSRPI